VGHPAWLFLIKRCSQGEPSTLKATNCIYCRINVGHEQQAANTNWL